jgi:hypothetical protein
MTHPEKLNAILYLLLSEVRNSKPNPKITFEFICKSVCEVGEDWEINFLKNTLVSDEYIFVNPILYELPKITPKGIKFIQVGGYKSEDENRDLEKKIKIETLKSLQRSKLSLILAVISIIISIVTGFGSYISSLEKNRGEKEFENQQKTIDSIPSLLKNVNTKKILKR